MTDSNSGDTSSLGVRLLRYLRVIGPGHRHHPAGLFGYVVTVAAVAITLYELWLASIGTHVPLTYSMVFLTVLLPVTFLTTTPSKHLQNLTLPDVILATASLACGVYLISNLDRYVQWVQGITTPTVPDTVVGTILIVLVIEATRRTVGWALTSIVLLLILYTFLGQYLPGTFQHSPVEYNYFLEQQIFTSTGLFGLPIQVAATYVFLFILFGTLFQKAGGGQFFFDIAGALTGRMIGGPAKACVTSSGLYGSISGSPTADVATTGQVNIPLMKRSGYTGRFAGAVEASASSGGALLPPVMGSAAFLMVEFTGIPYARIVQAGIFVALLYYAGVFLQVHHRTQRWGMGRMSRDQIVSLWTALKRGWQYLIPIVVLLYVLREGYTPSTIAFSAAVTTVIISWFKSSTRLGPRRIIEAFTTTVFMVVSLVGAIVAAGLVIGAIDLTGLAGKFTYLIFLLTGGYVIPALIAAAVICILLGMGMPTPAVYVMAAALIAPSLIELGNFGVLETHMFLLYFSCLSAITPPIAVAAFTAAPIADANPMGIAFQAVRLAIAGFIFPFVFMFRPGLLMQGSPLEIMYALASGAIIVFILAVAAEGWFGSGPLVWWERAVLAATALILIYPGLVSSVVGAVAALAILIFRYLKPRWAPKPEDRKPISDLSPQHEKSGVGVHPVDRTTS